MITDAERAEALAAFQPKLDANTALQRADGPRVDQIQPVLTAPRMRAARDRARLEGHPDTHVRLPGESAHCAQADPSGTTGDCSTESPEVKPPRGSTGAALTVGPGRPGGSSAKRLPGQPGMSGNT